MNRTATKRVNRINESYLEEETIILHSDNATHLDIVNAESHSHRNFIHGMEWMSTDLTQTKLTTDISYNEEWSMTPIFV